MLHAGSLVAAADDLEEVSVQMRLKRQPLGRAGLESSCAARPASTRAAGPVHWGRSAGGADCRSSVVAERRSGGFSASGFRSGGRSADTVTFAGTSPCVTGSGGAGRSFSAMELGAGRLSGSSPCNSFHPTPAAATSTRTASAPARKGKTNDHSFRGDAEASRERPRDATGPSRVPAAVKAVLQCGEPARSPSDPAGSRPVQPQPGHTVLIYMSPPDRRIRCCGGKRQLSRSSPGHSSNRPARQPSSGRPSGHPGPRPATGSAALA